MMDTSDIRQGLSFWTRACAFVLLVSGLLLILTSTASLQAVESQRLPSPWASRDIGVVAVSGGASHESGTFTLKGTQDIWGSSDGFRYVYQPLTGDGQIVARITSIENTNEHAKAGVMIRETLEPNAKHATMVVTPVDGVQFLRRFEAGGATTPTNPRINKGVLPYWVKLARKGNEFSGYESMDGKTWTLTGTDVVSMGQRALIGIVASSHQQKVAGTSTLDQVAVVTTQASARQRIKSHVTIINHDGTGQQVVYSAERHFEAPNWSPDGKSLILNSEGKLWRLPLAGGEPEVIPMGSVERINNDHGISPDGKELVVSANGGPLYILPFSGGEPRRITEEKPSYYHGWSPDGKTLAYVAKKPGETHYDIFRVSVNGGASQRLTINPSHEDGPDYSPDGQWIYFNSDRSGGPGSSDIWRIPAAGAGENDVKAERITSDDYVDWFPHPSLDGKWLIFLSYQPGTDGHPANKDVILRRMPLPGAKPGAKPATNKIIEVAKLFGGQGTINVASWSPDSRRFAYVSYSFVE
ncbi:MAG: hypothetical protein M3R15_01590 [Acidobacteriota bacterium]|nr:hypothetical protein [Acidobacteriota bacterium]